MCTGDEEGAQVVDLTEKIPGTKIAVFHPQITGLYRLEERPEQRAFLSMAVFARKDIGHQATGGFIDHQRCAGQGTPLGFTPFLDVLLTGFEAVAIDDFDPIPLKPAGAFTTHVLDERGKFASAIAHSFSRGMRLSTIQFAIDGDE